MRLEQARQVPADPAVLCVVIAIEMEHLAHQTAIAHVNRHGLEIRFDQRDGAARLRHADQFGKGSFGIGKIGEEPLSSSDIKRLVRKRKLLRVASPIVDGQSESCRAPACFLEKPFARIDPHHPAGRSHQPGKPDGLQSCSASGVQHVHAGREPAVLDGGPFEPLDAGKAIEDVQDMDVVLYGLRIVDSLKGFDVDSRRIDWLRHAISPFVRFPLCHVHLHPLGGAL